MGVSNSLPYDLEEEIPFSPPLHWQLFHGKKKDDDPNPNNPKEQVSIYKFMKSQTLNISIPQKGIQRLRTIKHPYVLSFIASSEMEDSLLMVTEYGVPLETWVRDHTTGSLTEAEKESLIMEILWGLKCILDACNFLHINCRISHCMLSPQSCFVTKNGDWKLGFMDLACDISSDTEHFRQNEAILNSTYRSAERVDNTWSEKYNRSQLDPTTATTAPSLGSAVDIFSLGKVIQYVFENLRFLEMPQCLTAPLKRMLSPEFKRRPTCASLLRLPCFESDQLALMTSISELQLKPTSECLDVFKVIKQKADVISRAACTFKILPSIGHSLNQAVNDFQNRDLRELSRQTVQASLDLLACFSTQHKVEEIPFLTSCLNPIQNLWTISDRSIRTSLLKTMKPTINFFPKDVVNKKIFEPMISGFSDSNAKLREETLKSLVYIVDKLDENQLQDKLVRCISTLQQDPENSIRTNATIFMSRIMPKLKESVRAKVLVPAYTKAMKDPFSHCRIAGLRATDASLTPVNLCDIQQLCGRLMPQVCLLLVDKSSDVRDLALNVLNSCMTVVKLYHDDNRKPSSNSHDDHNTSSNSTSSNSSSSLSTNISSPTTGNQNANPATNANSSGWASWAVDGFSKSIETAARNATTTTTTNSPPDSSIPVKTQQQTPSKSNETKNRKVDDWGDDDLDFDDDDDNAEEEQGISKVSVPATTPTVGSNQTKQWGDIPSSKTKSKQGKSHSKAAVASEFEDWEETPPISSSTGVGAVAGASKNVKLKEKNTQPAIKKMPAPTHSDFDDWDDPTPPKTSNGSNSGGGSSNSNNSQQNNRSVSSSVSKMNEIPQLDDEFDDNDLDNIDLPPGVAWGDEDDLDLDLNVLGNDSPKESVNSSKVTFSATSFSYSTPGSNITVSVNKKTSTTQVAGSSASTTATSTSSILLSSSVPAAPAVATPPTSSASSSSAAASSKPKGNPSIKKEKETTSTKKSSSSKAAPVVKKLALSSKETDNWDDF